VVNVTRVTNVYNVYNSNQRNDTRITYVNQRVNNGVTLVSRDTFVNARPVQRNLGRFDARQMADARVEREVQVQPVKASVLGSGAPARFKPPQAIVNRRVVATQKPAPPRQPFGQGQAVNVRTEEPNSRPQPLNNPQGNERPVARPQQPVSPVEADRASRADVPRPDARPQRPIVAPRVAEPVRPEGPTAPRPPQGAVDQNDRGRGAQGWSHPQAKPATAGAAAKRRPGADDEKEVPHLATAASAGRAGAESCAPGASPGTASAAAAAG
jgi:hypothetical protein